MVYESLARRNVIRIYQISVGMLCVFLFYGIIVSIKWEADTGVGFCQQIHVLWYCHGGCCIKDCERGMDIMATLNTVFKKVFLEELQEEGFVKVKGSLYAAMQRALAETRKVMLSVFDKTVDLNSCAKLFLRYGQDNYERLMYLKVSNRAELEEA